MKSECPPIKEKMFCFLSLLIYLLLNKIQGDLLIVLIPYFFARGNICLDKFSISFYINCNKKFRMLKKKYVSKEYALLFLQIFNELIKVFCVN